MTKRLFLFAAGTLSPPHGGIPTFSNSFSRWFRTLISAGAVLSAAPVFESIVRSLSFATW